MTHEEVVQEVIKHADVIAKIHPYCLLEKNDNYFIDRTGHVSNQKQHL